MLGLLSDLGGVGLVVEPRQRVSALVGREGGAASSGGRWRIQSSCRLRMSICVEEKRSVRRRVLEWRERLR